MTGDGRDKIGDPSQIAYVRPLRFDSGAAKGERLIEVRNAAGLCVNLLPDRCLDLGQVWLKGVPFAWMGGPDLPSADTGATLDTALGGLMATCGFDHIRQPETHGGVHYPLHGSMSLRGVDTLNVAQTNMGEPFVLCAQMERTGANGIQFAFNRRVEIDFKQPRLTIDDTVQTESGHPIMAMYHFNLGHPLIAADTKVTGFDRARLPRTSSVTECFSAQDTADQIVVQRKVGTDTLKFGLSFDKTPLPFVQIHTRASPCSNLLCIEPATHDRRPREEVLSEGSRSSRVRFRLTIELGVASIAAETTSMLGLNDP